MLSIHQEIYSHPNSSVKTVVVSMEEEMAFQTVSTPGSFINAIASLIKEERNVPTPHIMEEDIKLKFIEAYNLTMKDKKRIIQDSQRG